MVCIVMTIVHNDFEILPLWLIILYNEFRLIFLERTLKGRDRQAFLERERYQKLYEDYLKLYREYLDVNEYRLMFFDQYNIKPKTNDKPDKSEERS